jgi:4-hydroxybenzoate polyprenyltransferase
LNITSIHNQTEISRIKLFLALSRTQHVLLDMATPALAAVLWVGALPPPKTIVLGLCTAFAGYTTVYALNDMADHRMDQEKIQHDRLEVSKQDLDTLYVRHPIAQGLLSFKEGLLWTGVWAILAFIGSYVLNPICACIFLLSALLEVCYCLLLRISYLRVIISGMVKSSGALAAVFAVDSNPDLLFLLVLFCWLFFWEIGGQNVPNDWADMEADKHLGAKTVPILFGPKGSGMIILVCNVTAVILSIVIAWIVPSVRDTFYAVSALLVGIYTLCVPAYRLYKTKNARFASVLFNRASLYPLFVFGIVLAHLWV